MIKMQRLGVREKAKAKLIFNETLISVPPGESNQRSTESAAGCCGCFYFCLWVKEERGKLKQGGVGNVRRTVNDSDEPFDNQTLLFTSIMKPLRAETPPEQLSLTPGAMLCAVGAMAIRISQNFDLIFGIVRWSVSSLEPKGSNTHRQDDEDGQIWDLMIGHWQQLKATQSKKN